MGKWEMVRLGDVAKVQGGYAFVSSSFVKEGVPLIRIGNIKENYVKIDKGVCYPEKFWNEHPEYRVVENNILIAMSGATVGKLGIFKTNKRALLNQRVGNIVPNIEKIEQKYLFHYLTSIQFKRYIDVTAFGCAQPNISGKQIMDFPILLPPLEIQQKIAATLDTAAALLKLRQQQLAELEALIQSVFYQMFGDPVRNEKGWEVEKLGNLTTKITDGKHGDCQNEDDSGFYFISAKDINNRAIFTKNARQITRADFFETDKRTRLRNGDIIVVNTGATIGKTAIARQNDVSKNLTFQKSVAIISVNSEILISDFLEQYIIIERANIYKSASGSAQKNWLLSQIRDYKIMVPSIELQTQFAAIVEKIDQQKALVQQSIDETQTLFDSLMSQYFD